jgi:hypothetical protein
MRKKLITIMLFALLSGVGSSLLINIKSVQAKPPYLARCWYDAQGNLLSYSCNYIPSPDGCGGSNC